MTKPIVTIGVATYGSQSMEWAQHTAMLVNALPGYGIEVGGFISAASMAADYNRNMVVDTFLKSKSEYILWLDTDNLMPFGGVKRLLETGKQVVTGLYHLKRKPYNPIAYLRNKDTHGYDPIRDFDPGELLPIDMAGMGSVLIHRTAFEVIQSEYVVLQRYNNSVFPVHKDDILGNLPGKKLLKPYVGDGLYIESVCKADMTDKLWPFFYLEYGRTEDVVFYEMCKRVGIQPYCDTSVVCSHIGTKDYSAEDSRNYLKQEKTKYNREQEFLEVLSMYTEDGNEKK